MLSDPPLNVWVAVQLDGEVLTAHCQCMAGLAECCSHVGATLFYIKTVREVGTGETCTSLPCYWIASSNQKVEFAELTDIEFTAPTRKRQLLEAGNTHSKEPAEKRTLINADPDHDPATFFKKLHNTGMSSVALTVLQPYADAYVPKSARNTMPEPMSSLFKEENLKMDLPSLIAKSEETIANLQVTPEQVF